MKFTIEECLSKLPLPANEKWTNGVWDIEPHAADCVKLVFFAPNGKDFQTFHDEDEYYFIARGKATLEIDGERCAAAAGDAFFVAAKVPHHFENFTKDFAAWAVFF